MAKDVKKAPKMKLKAEDLKIEENNPVMMTLQLKNITKEQIRTFRLFSMMNGGSSATNWLENFIRNIDLTKAVQEYSFENDSTIQAP